MQRLSQVDLKVAVQAGHSLAAVHVDRGHARPAHDERLDGCDGGAAGDVLTLRVDQRGAGEQLLAQEAERRSHRFFFKCKTLFKALVEHFIPRLQVVDEEEGVRFPRRLLVQPVQLLLWQQGAQLLNDGVQLVLVAQPPHSRGTAC